MMSYLKMRQLVNYNILRQVRFQHSDAPI